MCKKCSHKCKCVNLDKVNKCLEFPIEGIDEYVIERDQKGIPTITADNFRAAYKGAGYAYAVDRLWQIWLLQSVGNGKLSEIIGAAGITSDAFFRQYISTEVEFNATYNTLSDRVKAVLEGWLEGINDRISEVLLDPTLIPVEFLGSGVLPTPLTIYELFNAGYVLGLELSSTLDTTFNQLDAATLLLELLGGYGAQAFDMAKDLLPRQPGPRAAVKTPTTSCDDCKCQVLLPDNVEPRNIGRNLTRDVENPSEAIKQVVDKHFHLFDEARKCGLPSFKGSWGLALSGKLTKTCDPVLISAGQLDFSFPSSLWQSRVKVISNEKIIHENELFTAVVPVPIISNVRNGNYLYSCTGQVTRTLGRDVLIEPIDTLIFQRTEVIEVNGGPDVPIDVYRSPNDGYTFQFLPAPLEGLAASARTPLIGQEALTLNNVERFFARTPKELRKLIDFPVSELLSQNEIYVDNRGNIGDVILGSWFQLSNEIDRTLPQTNVPSLLASGLNPIPPTDTYVVRSPPQDWNRPEGYYSNWNQNYANCFEYTVDVFGNSGSNVRNANRGLSIDNYLTKATNNFKKRLNPTQIRELMIRITNTNGYNFGLDSTNILPSFSSDNAETWLPILVAAIDEFPTADRLAVQAFLDDYNSEYVSGDNNNVVYSQNINDQWMLLNAIKAQLSYDLFNPTLGPIPTLADYFVLPTPVNPVPTPNGALLDGIGMEVLGYGAGNNANLVAFDWLGGANPNQIIVDAIDTALTTLGGFINLPWGDGLRPNQPAIDSNNTIIDTGFPILNRSVFYTILNADKKTSTLQTILFPGNSGEILLVDGTPTPSVHYNDQLESHMTFNLFDRPQFNTKLPCKKSCKPKLCRKPFVYENHPDSTGTNVEVDTCADLYGDCDKKCHCH